MGRWSGAPIRGVEPAFDDADPTGGRHAFDQDAALTPIFTTLRRGGWRRHRPQPSASSPRPVSASSAHRPQSASRPLRPVTDAAIRFRNDPLTAPLPVVPAAYGVDADQAEGLRPPSGYGAGSIDPYSPASFALPSPSPSEVTTWWRSPFGAASDRGSGGLGHGGAPAHDPAPYGLPYPTPASSPAVYEPAVYDPALHDSAAYYDARYDEARYDDDARYDGARYDEARYGDGRYGDARYDDGRYDEARYDEARYDDARYDDADLDEATYAEPVPYDISRRHRRFSDPMSYDPVTDSGRHHRRLAPAGW